MSNKRSFNRNPPVVDYISMELIQTNSIPTFRHESHWVTMHGMPFSEDATDCSHSHKQLVSLEHPNGIIISFVPPSAAQRCRSCRWRDVNCMPDAPVPPNACAAPWSSWYEAVLQCNHLHQSFTVVFETQTLVYTACIQQWISAGSVPSASKNWITERWSYLDGCGMW
jgi:hypothetical protein